MNEYFVTGLEATIEKLKAAEATMHETARLAKNAGQDATHQYLMIEATEIKTLILRYQLAIRITKEIK